MAVAPTADRSAAAADAPSSPVPLPQGFHQLVEVRRHASVVVRRREHDQPYERAGTRGHGWLRRLVGPMSGVVTPATDVPL